MSVAKKIFDIISKVIIGILAVILLINTYTIIARKVFKVPQPTVFGYSYAVVISGSMEPAISVNDMVFAKAQKEYNVGDVVTFYTGRSMVTHRIIEKAEDGFITKGDANNSPDLEPVPKEAIVGRIVYTLPNVGEYLLFMQSPLGMMILVLVALLIIEWPIIFKKKDEE